MPQSETGHTVQTRRPRYYVKYMKSTHEGDPYLDFSSLTRDQTGALAEVTVEDEVSWLRANVMGPNQAVWALRITARDRYSDRCWGWGEPLGIAMKALPTALEGARAV